MKKTNKLTLFAHLAAIITLTGWGCSFLSTKVLMENGGFTPVEMFSFRFAVAYILLLAITFKKIKANNWRDELNFLLCGVCAGSLYFITENFALQNTTSGNVSLLASISPIFTAILMAIFFKVRITLGVAVGSILAFIGCGCIIFSHGEGLQINPMGDLLAICAALSWATYSIAVKSLIPHYTTLFITRKLFFYGVVTSLPLLFYQTPLDTMGDHLMLLLDIHNTQYILNFLFLVVICSVTCYLLWNEVMKILGPVTSNNYLYAQPLVTMVAAYFLLGEHIFPMGYVGCLLIVGGLIISDKVKK
jgi:drug/metabolite transporter (DMT)-like permease